jgi:hypothetical protein
MKTKSRILKNTVYLLEAEIDDEILRQVIASKSHHPDKKAVIATKVEELKEDSPNEEIFEIGPDYLVTEYSMYFALFEDELKSEE